MQIHWQLGLWPLFRRLNRHLYRIACFNSSEFTQARDAPKPVATPASGSSTILERKSLIVPSTNVVPRDGSFALALLGSMRMVQSRILSGVGSKRVVDISLLFSSPLSLREQQSLPHPRMSTPAERRQSPTWSLRLI